MTRSGWSDGHSACDVVGDVSADAFALSGWDPPPTLVLRQPLIAEGGDDEVTVVFRAGRATPSKRAPRAVRSQGPARVAASSAPPVRVARVALARELPARHVRRNTAWLTSLVR